MTLAQTVADHEMNEQTIRSMDTIPAPSSLSTDDKDAMIAALKDKIDQMEKTLKDRKDF